MKALIAGVTLFAAAWGTARAGNVAWSVSVGGWGNGVGFNVGVASPVPVAACPPPVVVVAPPVVPACPAPIVVMAPPVMPVCAPPVYVVAPPAVVWAAPMRTHHHVARGPAVWSPAYGTARRFVSAPVFVAPPAAVRVRPGW